VAKFTSPESNTAQRSNGRAWWANICFWGLPCRRDLICVARREDRHVWLQGKGGALKPGQGFVLLPPREGEDENSPAGYLSPLRQALIDNNKLHVNVVVCESDYRALKLGIEHLIPGEQ
jgi:hypothetical protein